MIAGSCLCGAIRFRAEAAARPVWACHCSQCRKTSGHYWAATMVPRSALVIEGEAALRWYASSEKARRGFCGTCGASLFWDLLGEDHVSIAAGALDGPTGLTLVKHIHCATKGDYYEIEPGPDRAEGD